MTSRRIRVTAATAFALSCLFGISVGVVSAHAQYAGSTPAANATVSAAPSVVQITYTQELSDIQMSITGPDGSQVTTGQAKFDLAQRHNASVPTRDAGPGIYMVIWHNVSGEDGDSNDGSFVFTVASSTTTTVATGQTSTMAAATCMDNGVKTPGINDARIDTYCKRQAIRDKYANQIDIASFNDDVAAGKGLESALSDAMADFQNERAHQQH